MYYNNNNWSMRLINNNNFDYIYTYLLASMYALLLYWNKIMQILFYH